MAASVGTSSKSISGFDPRSLSGCVLWLDADDPYTLFSDAAGTTLATTTVNAWKDKSTNALLFAGGTSGPTLTKSTTVNSRPYLNFNGTTNYLVNTSVSVSQPYTVYAVAYSQNGNTNEAYIINGITGSSPTWSNQKNLQLGVTANYVLILTGNGTTLNNNLIFTGNSATGWLIYEATITGTKVYNFYNQTYSWTNSGTVTPSILTGLNIGGGYSTGTTTYAAGTSPWNGYIGEILMYNYALSASQRQQVEGYLAWKWGMTSSSITKPTAITLPVSHSFYISKPHSRQFSPVDVPGCTLWLDAADSTTMFQNTAGTTSITSDGQSIAAWRDKSSNAYLFTQATTANQPIYKVGIKNTNSITRWNGTSTGLQSSTILPFYTSASSGGSFFVVFMATTIATQRFLMTYQNQTTGVYCQTETELGYTTGANTQGNFGLHRGCSYATVSYGQIVANEYCLMSYILGNSGTTPANSTIFKNGTSVAVQNDSIGFYSAGSYPTANNARYLNIGYRFLFGDTPNCWHSGDFAELIWYNTPLSVSQRQAVEGYLAAKWGIPLQTHPYKLYPPLSSAPFYPINIPGCILWLDGNDPAGTGTKPAAGTLATWVDKSGSGYNATAAVAATYVPSTGALNFTGTQSYTTTLPSYLISQSGFAVVTFSGATKMDIIALTQTVGIKGGLQQIIQNYQQIITTYDGTIIAQATTTLPENTILLYNYTFDILKGTYIYYNGTQTISTNPPYIFINNNSTVNIGGYNGAFEPYIGNMYEIILYNTSLSTNQRQQVEAYLAAKWGFLLPLTHGYYKFQPSQLAPPIPITSITFNLLSTSLSTSWSASPDAASYIISLYSQSVVNGTLTLISTTTQTTTSKSFTTTAGTLYTAYMYFIDTSNISSSTLNSGAWATPTVTASITGTTFTTVATFITSPAGATYEYLLFYSAGQYTGFANSTGVFTGLTVNTAYTVSAKYSLGNSSATRTLDTLIICLVTPVITSISLAGTNLTINWNSVSNVLTSGNAYLFYLNGSSTAFTSATSALTSLTIDLGAQTNGATFYVNMRAYGTNTTSALSAASSTVTYPNINIRVYIIRTTAFNAIDTLLQTAKTNMGLFGTLTITLTSAQQANTGSTITRANYDVVIIYSDGQYSNSALGVALNSFITAGGSVIMSTFCWNQVLPGFTYTNGPFVYSGTQLEAAQTGYTVNVTHPITTGVGTTFSIARPYDNGNLSLQTGATKIATSSTGYPLIGIITIGSARQVGFNSYIDLSFADTTGNFQKLVCRSIYWCLGLI